MRVLHLHSSFSAGGKELRCAQLINAFGPEISHSIVSAEPGAMGAAKAIDPQARVDYPDHFPSLTGRPLPGRLQQLARWMEGYDLVLTYNWGAMDAVMAHTLFAGIYRLPPLVHHEDGFNHDEAQGLKPSRNWYRRIALGRAAAVVVPSARLEQIALETWQQPRAKVRRIANGIATRRYGRKPRPDAMPRVIKRAGELWLGTIAGLRPVKNLPRLVRAFAAMPEPWHLVILGDGPERDAIRDEALRLELGHRVHLAGFVADPAAAIGLFDLFALSSDSEQFPISVVEAMAAGLAVAAPAVGDVTAMVAAANVPLIAPAGDEAALGEALRRLAGDPALRRALGAANRERARAEFDEEQMFARYREVYAAALRRAQFP
ncbi:MAG: glycosyltransferase family 4 protein [Novosphingobium sp.]